MQKHDIALAGIARMIGEPARAAMLHALLGGEALSAGALARRAQVAPATASAHLAKLVDAGLLLRLQRGRERHYALANADVAAALEALARITSPNEAAGAHAMLRFARTCYDHLAGTLGVQLTEHLVARGMLRKGSLELQPSSEAWLHSWGIDVTGLRKTRRPLTRACLDWTERRDHLAGAAGAAIVDVMLQRGWLVRLPDTRAVRLTVRGGEALYRAVGFELASS
ncbi:MAG: ArsR/SmtB family transcription factor [Gemmatimonadota bacterium]